MYSSYCQVILIIITYSGSVITATLVSMIDHYIIVYIYIYIYIYNPTARPWVDTFQMFLDNLQLHWNVLRYSYVSRHMIYECI